MAQGAKGATAGWALHRSVTLLRVFSLASAGILLTGAILLGWLLTNSLRDQALEDSGRSLSQYVEGVLRPQLVREDELHVSPVLPQRVRAQLRLEPDILSVKVWGPDGTLVWTSRAPERIGQRFPTTVQGDLGETIESKRAHAALGRSARPRSTRARSAPRVSSRRESA
jgi:hypothetical protein